MPPTVAGAEPHIPFLATGAYPLRPGNRVRPLVDGEAAFRRIGEAIAAAQHSVWFTVTFMTPDFRMPDGGGGLFDMLDRAVARGLDVRVIFWRHNPESSGYGKAFFGTQADHDMLRARGSRFRIRWDRAHGAYCQHQKMWIVDAGQASETAFVGGMNLRPAYVVPPGHAGVGEMHDLYVEVTGPSASDVHHNFVQRWNEASERHVPGGVWGHDGDDDLVFPTHPSAARGASLVQIQRTVHAGRYSDGHPSPHGRPFAIAGGERSILEQYLQAIDAARRSIYIENQAVPIVPVAARLEAALKRGVEVVALVPADPEDHVRIARRNPEHRAHFEQIAALGRYETFALVGIAGHDPQGGRTNIYVHAKAMLVDDAWATIGSGNLHRSSLFGNTEMNVAFWDPAAVRALRCALLAEHLGEDTAHLDDRAALGLYRRIARDNLARRQAGDADWQGLAFALDPATYGDEPNA
jgi:phosphatidylserine/phosphatidylglycerophosphate/cardiolipin synthase-like enzyme